MSTHVLIVDDHAPTRSALHTWLDTTFPTCEFRESETGEQAVEMALAIPPHLVLMDIRLPGISGIAATARIKAAIPSALVVIFSMHDAPDYRTAASAAGACGYALKSRIHTELMPLLRKLLPS
jgi:DNA-binding NarL/FixJ family response regulator